MKRLRRLGIFLGLLLLAVAGFGLFMHHRITARPVWYHGPVVDVEIQHAGANSMTQKLIGIYSQVNRMRAEQIRASLAGQPATHPINEPISIELSENEINGFFSEWDVRFHWREGISKYAQDPVVTLEDNELIIAGTIKDWNAVASIHLTPAVQGNKLTFIPTTAMIGTQDVPRSYLSGNISKLSGVMDRKLPELREASEIEPRGWANPPAVAVAMSELLMHVLNDEPAENVLFIPEKIGRDSRSLPVKVTHVDIS